MLDGRVQLLLDLGVVYIPIFNTVEGWRNWCYRADFHELNADFHELNKYQINILLTKTLCKDNTWEVNVDSQRLGIKIHLSFCE